MLGRGLESLIPAGGYRKPEEPSHAKAEMDSTPPAEAGYGGANPPTGPGQAYSINPGQLPSAINARERHYDASEALPQQPAAIPPYEERSEPGALPAEGFTQPSEQQYPGGYRPSSGHQQPAGEAPREYPQHQAMPIDRQAAPIYGHPSSAMPPAPNYYPTSLQEGGSNTPQGAGQDNKAEGRDSSYRGEPELDYSRGQASVFQIEVEKIFPNPHQPRRHFDEDALNELANSIREFGIIQPLVVTKVLKETESGTEVTYQLIAGERRLMAAKRVGLRTVPAVVKRVGMDRERLELAIIENIQRENLNPLEAARSYARLQDEFGLTQREIAIRMGKSRETIANTLRLLNLPSEIQQALEDGRINESAARLLLQIDDIARQKDMFQSILRSKPSVRELKATIRREKTGGGGNYLNPELISLQSRLEEFLGTKAQIDDNGGKGKITINYYSPEELSALIGRLSGEDF